MFLGILMCIGQDFLIINKVFDQLISHLLIRASSRGDFAPKSGVMHLYKYFNNNIFNIICYAAIAVQVEFARQE